MAKTICPACGHSPIPPGAEECPVCHEPFAFLQTHKKAKNKFIDKRDAEENESTVFGGAVTGEVAAHPYQAAITLFVGAALWFLRASGMLGGLEDPQWVYGIVIADLLMGLLLIINAGPAKLLAQAVLLVQLGAALYLGRGSLENPVHALYALHALMGLFLVFGEPSVVRRQLGLIVGLLVAAAAVLVMTLKPEQRGPPRIELVNPQAGYRLLLPQSYSRARPPELAQHLKPLQLPLTASALGFASMADRTVGILVVNRDESLPAIGGCQSLHQDLGGTNVPKPLPDPAPKALGEEAVTYELRTFSGASGRLACGKLADGRFVGLAVLSVNPDADAGARAFNEVGSGLSLQ